MTQYIVPDGILLVTLVVCLTALTIAQLAGANLVGRGADNTVLSKGLFAQACFQPVSVSSADNKARRTLTYLEYRERTDMFTNTPKAIPKVIFRTGPFTLDHVRTDVLEYLDNAVQVNPGFTQVYFSDKDCIDFVKDVFPQYLQDYKCIIPGAFKADVWRLMVLYHFGGVYSDVGHIFLKPIINSIDFDKNSTDLVLVSDLSPWTIHNAFIAAKPRNPFLLFAIKHIMKLVHDRQYGSSVLSITGPRALGDALKLFYQESCTTWTSLCLQQSKGLMMWRLEPQALFICNQRNENVIRTKFPNYYKITYDYMGNQHYTKLWTERKVYCDSLLL